MVRMVAVVVVQVGDTADYSLKRSLLKLNFTSLISWYILHSRLNLHGTI